jgi:hypothetical protein
METDAYEEQLTALDQQRKLDWLTTLRHEFEKPHELAEWVGPDVTLADLYLGDLHDEDDEAWPVFQIARDLAGVPGAGTARGRNPAPGREAITARAASTPKPGSVISAPKLPRAQNHDCSGGTRGSCGRRVTSPIGLVLASRQTLLRARAQFARGQILEMPSSRARLGGSGKPGDPRAL